MRVILTCEVDDKVFGAEALISDWRAAGVSDDMIGLGLVEFFTEDWSGLLDDAVIRIERDGKMSRPIKILTSGDIVYADEVKHD